MFKDPTGTLTNLPSQLLCLVGTREAANLIFRSTPDPQDVLFMSPL